MFGMGVDELLVVLVVVLLVFGPGRLPEMMGNLGRAMREFQKGLREPPEDAPSGLGVKGGSSCLAFALPHFPAEPRPRRAARDLGQRFGDAVHRDLGRQGEVPVPLV